MSTVAIVTYQDEPTITNDDKLVADWLGRSGIHTAGVPWDDPSIDWSRFDLIVLRSCWDYHLRPDEFRSWLQSLGRESCRALNPITTVQWNLHKGYLRELELKGVPVLPTVWLPRGSKMKLSGILSREGWDEAVIKPMISASATNTFRSTSPLLTEEKLDELLSRADMMVQQFCKPLVEHGELSVVFFDREYSHAIRKIPKRGDFRTQKALGPTFHLESLDSGIVAQARDVLEKVSGELLYARVDGVMLDGRFTLIELEIIEPSLMLGMDPDSPARFGRAILKHLSLGQAKVDDTTERGL